MSGRSATPRGFTIYDQLTDTHGCRVRVQQSSSALSDCAWVFCEAADGSDASPHLNVEQARRVRDALSAFITEFENAP